MILPAMSSPLSRDVEDVLHRWAFVLDTQLGHTIGNLSSWVEAGTGADAEIGQELVKVLGALVGSLNRSRMSA